MKFVVKMQCTSPTEDFSELAADFAVEDFIDFCDKHNVCIEGTKIHFGEDRELKDTYFPEGFFSKKRPQEKPKEYIVPLTYDDIYYGIWKDPKELIRCRDCKYHTGKWCKRHSTEGLDLNDRVTTYYDFCSEAERKEE